MMAQTLCPLVRQKPVHDTKTQIFLLVYRPPKLQMEASQIGEVVICNCKEFIGVNWNSLASFSCSYWAIGFTYLDLMLVV